MVRYGGFMKPVEASNYLGIPVNEIYKMLEERELPGLKIGNRWRIRISELERWLDEEVSKEELVKLSKRLKDVDGKSVERFLSPGDEPSRKADNSDKGHQLH